MADGDKISAGQVIRSVRAGAWNNAMDAGEAFAASQFSVGSPFRSRPRSTDIIKCKNNSGAARSRGEVLGAFGLSLTNLDPGNIQLTGNTPATGKHFGILLKALPSGEIGELQVSGVCLATVTVGDESHEYANLDDGAYKLVSAASGPVKLIYAPTGTGDKECVICLGSGGSNVTHAKTPSGGIPAMSTLTMGSASCDIYSCSSAGVLSDSGTNETIYNMASGEVAGSTHIIASRNTAGLLVVIVEDCGGA